MPRRSAWAIAMVVVAALAVVTPAGAVIDEGTLSAPFPDVAGFGRSVAVDGDTAVVGAEGEVHVYERTASGWSHQAALYDANTGFGMFVAVGDDTLAVSIDDETRVYARSGDSWDLQQTLNGQGVAVDGDTLVLGSGDGCMSIYEQSDGVWAAAFSDCRNLKPAVAIDGDSVVVGGERGAHVYRRTGARWSHDVYLKLRKPYVGYQQDPLRAGHSVAVSGETLVFGQPDGYDVIFGGMSGTVFVFVDTGLGWEMEERLVSPDEASYGGDWQHDFGRAVALDGDTLIVGATGHAYLFRRTAKTTAWWLPWSHEESFEVEGSEQFGASVAMSPTTAVIGAPGTTDTHVYDTAITCLGLAPTIVGTGGDDVIRGTPGRDIIAGMAGHDTIYGRGGDDVICGDRGNDTIYGNDGSDLISGGYGTDEIRGGAGADLLWGNADPDRIYGGPSDDTLHGGAGIDELWGHSGADVLCGSAGGDLIYGGLGADTVRAGAGDDQVFGGAGGDLIYGGLGADTVWAGAGRDRVFGKAGNDILNGQGGRDHLRGQDGDDVIDGGTQKDWCSVETSVVNCEVLL